MTREEFWYQTIKDGLDLVLSENVVMFDDCDILQTYIKSNWETNDKSLRVFDRQRIENGGIIFPKNSPLIPILQQPINSMRENGVLSYLDQTWFGKLDKERQHENLHVLSIGQFVTVFIFFLGGLSGSLLLLISEFLFSNCNITKTKGKYHFSN